MEDLAQTILYLRPQTPEATDVLSLADNKPYQFEVAPLPEPVDIPLGEVPNLFLTSHLSPYGNASHDRGRISRESTPGLYAVSLGVLRLGFDSLENPSARGFEIGSGPKSNIIVPFYSKNPSKNPQKAYFRIHYNFNSGALLITALDWIKVGSARLKEQESLLLMTGTSIYCGGEFEFTVEFPDLSSCAEEHKRNYEEYAGKLGISGAHYLATPRVELPPIGAKHRSVAILGRGAFGEVHKALNTKDGEQYAIKIFDEGGEGVINEANIMSSLDHENIIKYESAFKLHSGQACIVMELAVNDLHTHLKARQNSKCKPYLSMACIQSICRQGLLGLRYLHSKGFMHRDLKPRNILVTDWNVQTDTPFIKLADFGLASKAPEQKTYCGTKGFIAPEVMKANELRKRKGEGRETGSNQPLMYTNAVDIWAFGKVLQDLIQRTPSHISLRHGKKIPVNREPALRLIRQMMEHDPQKRPTAADCLEDPWMVMGSLAQKRDRSPTPLPSSTGQPIRKVIRKAFENSITNTEDLTTVVMNVIGPGERSVDPNVEMKGRSFSQEGQTPQDCSKATQLTSKLGKDGQLSPTARGHNDTLLLDTLVAQNESTVLRSVARRLRAEGYDNDVAVGGSNAVAEVIQDAMLGFLFENDNDNDRQTGSFWNEEQFSVNRNIRLQSSLGTDRILAMKSQELISILNDILEPNITLNDDNTTH